MRQKKMNDHYVFKFIDIEIFTFLSSGSVHCGFKQITCNYLQFTTVFALIVFTYLPESQIKKKIIFIQTNSFINFTCPNPVFLVPSFRQVG